MKGYDVRTIDDDKVGHVVDTDGDFFIVEHGLLKSKHALPMTFAEVDEDAGVVRTTLSKSLIHDSPKVNGEIDRQAIAEHYGLAEGFTDPPTRGLGDVLEPDDPAFGADDGYAGTRHGAQRDDDGRGPARRGRLVAGRHRRRPQARLPEDAKTEPAGSRRCASSRAAHPAWCAPRRRRASPGP